MSRLSELQERSFAAAGRGVRSSYPPTHRLRSKELFSFLRSRRYGVLATARADGRPRAAPVGYTLWKGAFWVASVEGGRLRDLRARPHAAIVVMEGEGGDHRAVIAEGPVKLHDQPPGGLVEAWRTRHGASLERWAAATIELRPARLFSYSARGGST